MATTKRTSLMAHIRKGVSWIYFKLAGAQKRLVEEAWQEQVDSETAMLLRLASLEGLNYGEVADEAALIALDEVEDVVKDGGLATIEGVQGIYVYDLGAESGDVEGSYGWWNLDIDGKVTYAQVVSGLESDGRLGFYKVLGEVDDEAALPEDPTLGDAYLQMDLPALRVCTAEAIVDPPTPATWSTKTAGTDWSLTYNTDTGVLKRWSSSGLGEVATVGTALTAVLADLATKGITGYRKALAFVANEAALPATPTLGDAYVQNDDGALRVCTAEAIVDPPTPAVWSTEAAGTAVFIVHNLDDSKTYFWDSAWTEIGAGCGGLFAIVADTTALVALTGYADGDEVLVLDLDNGLPGRVVMDVDNAGVAESMPSEYRAGAALAPYNLYTPDDADGGNQRWRVIQAMIPHEGIGYADIADFATGAAVNQRTYIGSERSVSFRATALADGDTVEVDDGVTAVTFEFDDGLGGGVTPGNTAVLIGASKLEALTNLKTAINAAWAGPAPAVVVDLGGGDAELVMWGWTADLVLDATIAGGGAWTWMSPAKPDDGDGVPNMRVGLVLLDITDEMLAAPFSGAIRKYVGSASTSGWGACTDADDYPVIGIRAMAAAGTVKSVGDTAVTPVCVAGPGGTASLYLDIVLDGLAAGDMLVIEIGNYGL